MRRRGNISQTSGTTLNRRGSALMRLSSISKEMTGSWICMLLTALKQSTLLTSLKLSALTVRPWIHLSDLLHSTKRHLARRLNLSSTTRKVDSIHFTGANNLGLKRVRITCGSMRNKSPKSQQTSMITSFLTGRMKLSTQQHLEVIRKHKFQKNQIQILT